MFRYGICNETFGEMPLTEALRMAKAAGYEGWEIAPFVLTEDVESFGQSARASYREQVIDAGLQVIGLHWLLAKTEGYHLTTRDSETRKRTADYLQTLAVLCHDLGGDVMVLGSPQQRNFSADQSIESAMQNAAEVLSLVTKTLEQTGVRIALEPLGRGEGNFLNTAQQARQLMAMVDDPGIALHLDVKAMSDEATPITQIIRENADVTIHFHANDPNLRGPGMGDVKFAPIMKSLDETGYDKFVSVEVFDYSPGVQTLVEQSLVNLKAAEPKA